MGRKIPGKKHRKIVDPEKQRYKREASLKDKINQPPQNPDEQEVPKSVLLITELKKKAKLTQKNKKRIKKKQRKKNVDQPLSVDKFLDRDEIQSGMVKPDKFIPNLVQRPQETVESFYRRVNSMTQEIIKETQFEDKFGVAIKKDLTTGKILQIEKSKGKSLKKKREKNGKKTLKEKRKEKQLNKKMNEDVKDFSHLKDIVEFGEVVHRPPVNLNLKSNKLNKIGSTKGNKYKDLLLQDLIMNKNKSVKNKSVKDPVQLEKEEKQRQFIVNAYRERKKKKYNASVHSKY